METAWLGDMRRTIGMSRNHLSWILDATPQTVTRWENGEARGMSPDQIDAVENMRLDYDSATTQLDEQGLTWDDVVPLRLAAMNMGLSINTLHSLMKRKEIKPLELGLLGLWITHEDMAACRR